MKRSGMIAAGVITLFAAYLFVSSFFITSEAGAALGPAFMPRLLGVILFVLGIADFAGELKKTRLEEKETKTTEQSQTAELAKRSQTGSYKDWIARHIDICSIAVLLAYVFAIKPLGFLISSAIYMFVHMLLLTVNTKRNYLVLVFLTLVVPCVVYFGFVKIFYLMLPPGILG